MATILIVDDDTEVRSALRALLETEGHTVEVAGDGSDAVLRAARACPDLVVMDLAMPRLDGLNATRLLRRGQDTADVKVLLVSAHTTAAEWPKLRQLGFDGVLRKPVEPARLLAEVERLLASSDGRRAVVPREARRPRRPGREARVGEGSGTDRASMDSGSTGRSQGTRRTVSDWTEEKNAAE